jgi:glycosyltransferase involved in cell wall biosynthesis
MRILVLTPTFLPLVGGAEIVLFEVYRRLAARHDVELLTPARPARVTETAIADYAARVPFRVQTYEDRCSFIRLRGHRVLRGALPPFSLSAVTAVCRAASRCRPDVVNVHYVMPTGLAALAAERRLDVPALVTLNGRDVPGPGVPPLWRAWHRWVLARVSGASYVSEYCRAAIWGREGGRGEVIYNGVEIPPPPGDAARARAMLGVASDEPVVLALQRLAPEKRVDVVLRAWAHALARGATGTLAVAGTGPEEMRLRELACELGIGGRVRFLGYVPNAAVADLFEAAAVFAFHSTFETFGLVVAQAMSYAKPVITVRNTALPEIVGDGGVLVDTLDAAGFADALVGLLGDGSLRRRLGSAGRVRAARLFDWGRIADQYEAALVRAARSRRVAARRDAVPS